MKLRIRNDRQLNMAIDRKRYVEVANSMSGILVEHLLKLLTLKSPQDIKGWKESVKKSFHVDTQNLKGNFKKPIYEHICDITDANNNIDLRSIKNELDWLLSDSDYIKLPRKSNISSNELANQIEDLLSRISPTRIYNKSDIDEIVDSWWEANKWY